jgi:mono/diheme cytochrome c family protein
MSHGEVPSHLQIDVELYNYSRMRILSTRPRKGRTAVRQALLVSVMVFVTFASLAKEQAIAAQAPFPSEWVPSGEVMYKQFCAACHGAHAQGNGPVASRLKTRPTDLTTLSKRHGGKFPYDYVLSILRFGPGSSAHGSSEMPTWGPIFQTIDSNSEHAQDRIKNLTDYLASLQRK